MPLSQQRPQPPLAIRRRKFRVWAFCSKLDGRYHEIALFAVSEFRFRLAAALYPYNLSPPVSSTLPSLSSAKTQPGQPRSVSTALPAYWTKVQYHRVYDFARRFLMTVRCGSSAIAQHD
jgi:hypothetical protein